jgi:Fic family protein
MLSFLEMILAYNLSSNLSATIKQIEQIRVEFMLLALPPKTEARLSWEAKIEKTYWSLILSGNKLSKNQMAKLLSSYNTNRLTKEEKEVVNYKKALSYINQEWLVSGQQLTISGLNTLFDICCRPTINKNQSIAPKNKKDLNLLFDYLHTSNEHPFIQAGISQISMVQIAPYSEGNGRMARLIPYIYLYKNGYNFKNLLVLDEFLRRDLVGLNLAVESVEKSKNLTVWLEYFVKGCMIQLDKAYGIAKNSRFNLENSSKYSKLNDRQKTVLDMLEPPGSKISNMVLQKEFKISQITASRDLAKLNDLDLILAHGKGRSTYYTKA